MAAGPCSAVIKGSTALGSGYKIFNLLYYHMEGILPICLSSYCQETKGYSFFLNGHSERFEISPRGKIFRYLLLHQLVVVITKPNSVVQYLPLCFQLLMIFVRRIAGDLSSPKSDANDCVSDAHDKKRKAVD